MSDNDNILNFAEETEDAPVETGVEEPAESANPEEGQEQAQTEDTQEEKQDHESKRKPGSARQRERAERAEARAVAAERLLADMLARQGHTSQPAPQGKPDIDDPRFQTVDEYYNALAEYKAKEQLQLYAMQQEAQRAQYEQARAQQEWETRLANHARSIPDWEEAMEEFNYFGAEAARSAPAAVNAAGAAIARSEVGPELVYHLGKNPDLIKKIAEMSPYAAVMEIGRLEERIASKKTNKPQSNAPAPLKPVKPSGVRPKSSGDEIVFY